MEDKNERKESLRKAYDESLKELEKYSVEELEHKENCVMCNVEINTETLEEFEVDSEDGFWCMPCAIQESDC